MAYNKYSCRFVCRIGHNIGQIVCGELAPRHDDHLIGQIKGISDEQEKIAAELDLLISGLRHIEKELLKAEKGAPINLKAISSELEELKEKLLEKDPELFNKLEEGKYVVDQEFAEMIKSSLESVRRGNQNALPRLISNLQLQTELYVAAVRALQAAEETHERGCSAIVRNSRG